VTRKPVVGVGRYTSPDATVSAIRRGVMDMIGAARPSIADPFLPRKIEEGRLDDIRECIGCNICVSGEVIGAPMRCTQNPTMGEEWRCGWHPESIPARRSKESFLVVGAGPAGLEAARALGQRGARVILAEARDALGGRVADEYRLPGIAAWARVRDWRVGQIDKMRNVEVFKARRMAAADVLGFGAARVVIATGSRWRSDGFGRTNRTAIPGTDRPNVHTPHDIMADVLPADPVVIFDDDHYYMGGVLAEALRVAGRQVTLVTPAALASIWTEATLEQWRIQKRLLELGVDVIASHNLIAVNDGAVELACQFTERRRTLPAAGIVMVTSRLPDDALYEDLVADDRALADAGIADVSRVGDCLAPGTIAAAVHAGHRFARELTLALGDAVPFAVESIVPRILTKRRAPMERRTA